MKLEELEKRINVLEDIKEIKDLHREYIFWLASQKWDEIVECFAENATIEIATQRPRKGREEITTLFKDVVGRGNVIPGVKLHRGGQFLFQPVITVDGERAKGHWILDRFYDDPSTPGGSTLKVRRGKYNTEYVKEDGKWKFSYLKWEVPWPLI